MTDLNEGTRPKTTLPYRNWHLRSCFQASVVSLKVQLIDSRPSPMFLFSETTQNENPYNDPLMTGSSEVESRFPEGSQYLRNVHNSALPVKQLHGELEYEKRTFTRESFHTGATMSSSSFRTASTVGQPSANIAALETTMSSLHPAKRVH